MHMGWLFYTPTHYKYSGKKRIIDRKAECDDLFNKNCYEILKSSVVGSTYYAAVAIKAEPAGKDSNGNTIYKPVSQKQVFASIILTAIDKGDFGYKDMDETCGPCEDNCPIGILNLLTPTNNKWANEWRNACRNNAKKKRHSKLPIGTVIRFDMDGKHYELKKCAPAYQFKTPWWYDISRNCYMQKKYIPDDFEIVTG